MIKQMKTLHKSIEEHYDIDPDTELLEAYAAVLHSNRFSVDPVIIENRINNSTIPNKLEYVLEDGSTVAISEETFKLCNHHINTNKVVSFMNESKENFISVIKEIIKE